ncbi:MAG: hypothetical protein Q9183_006662, partial [Haloplaca sp. 2 TL-2023]
MALSVNMRPYRLPPAVPLDRSSSSTLSYLELLMIGKERRVSFATHIYHTHYSDSNIADHLVTVLPRPTLLALRAVSGTTKKWVEGHCTDLLKRLRVTCPLPRFSIHASSTLRRLADDCTHLTITLLPSSKPIPAGTPIAPTPAQQIFIFVHNCSSLRIEVPASHSFEPLLSLHHALKAGTLKSITHIQFEGLNAAGLLALRWGGFDALEESTWISGSIWRGLTSLSIGIKCKEFNFDLPKPNDLASEEEIEKYRKDKQTYRQAAQILHNYFFHLAREGQLEKLQFDWIDGIGPNPLLLDVEITLKDDQAWRWFSAPGI